MATAAQRQLALQYDDVSDVLPTAGALSLLGTLDRLGVPWCVVTSADAKLAGTRLSAAGIDAPRLVTVQDVRRGKPDPEGHLLAAGALGVDPRRCLVVEDSVPGLDAGRRAGAITASLRGLPADLMLADLAQLDLLLARRCSGPLWVPEMPSCCPYVTFVDPRRTQGVTGGASAALTRSACAIWVSWPHSSTRNSADPAKANQNGAVTPNREASTPPMAEPATSPP